MAEKKKGQVKDLKFKKTWGDQRTNYQYDIVMENGDKGDWSTPKYTKVEDIPFKVGDEIEYEHDTSGRFPRLKPLIGGGGGYKGGSRKSVDRPSVAMRMAVDLVVGHPQEFPMEKLLPTADKIYDWMKSKD